MNNFCDTEPNIAQCHSGPPTPDECLCSLEQHIPHGWTATLSSVLFLPQCNDFSIRIQQSNTDLNDDSTNWWDVCGLVEHMTWHLEENLYMSKKRNCNVGVQCSVVCTLGQFVTWALNDANLILNPYSDLLYQGLEVGVHFLRCIKASWQQFYSLINIHIKVTSHYCSRYKNVNEEAITYQYCCSTQSHDRMILKSKLQLLQIFI